MQLRRNVGDVLFLELSIVIGRGGADILSAARHGARRLVVSRREIHQNGGVCEWQVTARSFCLLHSSNACFYAAFGLLGVVLIARPPFLFGDLVTGAGNDLVNRQLLLMDGGKGTAAERLMAVGYIFRPFSSACSSLGGHLV